MKRTLTTVFLCLLLATSAWAGVDEGTAAFGRGDYATALREWRPLAERGDVDAQRNLGFMYANGRGVPQDYAEAAKWFSKAAAQSDAGAQLIIGLMYAKGRGMPQNGAKAVRWFRKAAEQGNAGAQHNLALMYTKGRGVAQDYVQAHKWSNLAAKQGHKKARAKRDSIAKKLMPAQLAEAHKLAREWQAAFEKQKGK